MDTPPPTTPATLDPRLVRDWADYLDLIETTHPKLAVTPDTKAIVAALLTVALWMPPGE